MATVALLGTCDTKLHELLFLRSAILSSRPSLSVILIDVGRHPASHPDITIPQAELLAQDSLSSDVDISTLTRGQFIEHIARGAGILLEKLHAEGRIHGAVSAGGSGGTSLAASAMRDSLPIGFPKLIVSTMASGDVRPIVGETDIALMYSVVDVAGLNDVLRDVLSNAGAAIAGAALSYATRHKLSEGADESQTEKKHRVGITMFGVTTPAVDAIRKHLESRYPIQTYVFHATGTGGLSLERLIRTHALDAVLDLTTTEVADHIAGGILSAGEDRLAAAPARGIPYVVSLGALDMVNFGPRSSVPERYAARKLFEHNPIVTLMRTSPDECRQIGEFICDKLKAAKSPDMVQVWIPQGGVSIISVKDGPFEDREADKVLFETVTKGLEGSGIEVVLDERAVNDEAFAKDIAEALVKKMGLASEGCAE
ncbi:transcriptional regulator [Purpureocillium lavendulum]|uniref:Transcriptional regulator n=1 Tax=Purpureocillium lavendulum TaxID=1247861 RepID=A0AB34G5Q2_9HYPO|nr:transcriptional regulator [Purpureocillium lavendulum]